MASITPAGPLISISPGSTMLDEVAIAERVGQLVRSGGFEPKIKEILAPAVELKGA